MRNILKAIVLDRSIPVPLYYQLKRQMLELIEQSVLHPGDMLPTENELCEMLQVSRPTIRQAFRDLCEEGYLIRYKAKGTFVANPKVKDQFLSKLDSFNREMIAKGKEPKTTVMSLEKLAGTLELNEKLKLPYDAPLIRLSRLRFADNVETVYVDTYLSYDRFSDLMDVDFTVHSLYQVLEDIYHVRVSRAQREIEAVNARKSEAALLNVAPNKALCLVRSISYTSDSDQPVEYSVARYRGDMTKFTVEIYR